MKLAGVVALVSLMATAVVADTATTATNNKKPPTELLIGIRKRVPECKLKAKKGDELSMHYRGTLFDTGAEFDSSISRGTPFDFTLGVGHVIKGWDRGIVGMCVGEQRRLKIPSELAYGKQGSPPAIPGNSALVFDIELLAINGETGEPVKAETASKAADATEKKKKTDKKEKKVEPAEDYGYGNDGTAAEAAKEGQRLEEELTEKMKKIFGADNDEASVERDEL